MKQQNKSLLKSADFKNGLIVYSVVILLFCIVCINRALTGTDPLDNVVFTSDFIYNITNEFRNISWWPISHFIMYTILGIVATEYWYIWVIAGVLWEIFEYVVTISGTNKLLIKPSPSNKQYGNNWIAGSFTDIFVNSAGLVVGICIAKMLKKPKNRPESIDEQCKRRKATVCRKSQSLFTLV
jgi:glycopeptide antibiotics resistance protein